jgi:hypothetical protein
MFLFEASKRAPISYLEPNTGRLLMSLALTFTVISLHIYSAFAMILALHPVTLSHLIRQTGARPRC